MEDARCSLVKWGLKNKRRTTGALLQRREDINIEILGGIKGVSLTFLHSEKLDVIKTYTVCNFKRWLFF